MATKFRGIVHKMNTKGTRRQHRATPIKKHAHLKGCVLYGIFR